jgi:hypothetical protein
VEHEAFVTTVMSVVALLFVAAISAIVTICYLPLPWQGRDY